MSQLSTNSVTNAQDAKIRVDKEQTEVDVKLQLRVGDVEFWKGELDNKLAQIKEEIEEAVGDVLTFANPPVCSRSPNHLLLAKTIEMGNLRTRYLFD